MAAIRFGPATVKMAEYGSTPADVGALSVDADVEFAIDGDIVEFETQAYAAADRAYLAAESATLDFTVRDADVNKLVWLIGLGEAIDITDDTVNSKKYFERGGTVQEMPYFAVDVEQEQSPGGTKKDIIHILKAYVVPGSVKISTNRGKFRECSVQLKCLRDPDDSTHPNAVFWYEEQY